MFRRRPAPDEPARVGVPRGLLWLLLVLDAVAAVWMYTAGRWLDTANTVTAVVTLGGNHRVVLGLAVAGFLMLAVAALLTDGFDLSGRGGAAAATAAAVVSVVALAGGLSVIVLVVATVWLAGFVLRRIR